MARVEQVAWVVEQQIGQSLCYWCGHGWSRDHMRAVRFARECDADAVQKGQALGGKVAEHGWVADV